MKYLFKTIIRNFRRKPITNFINLLGLAISFTLVIILSVYCYSEITTDQFHRNVDRIYLFGTQEGDIYSPGILKENIDSKIPAVESTLRIGGTWDAPVFQTMNREPITSDLIFADDNFFKLFTYKCLEGDLESALKEPLSVVISKSLSLKLFGKEEPLGKTIKLNNDKNLTVSAVIEEPKANSCLVFSAIASIATRKIVQENGGEYTDWGWSDFQTFVMLKKGVNPDAAQKIIHSLFPQENQDHIRDTKLIPLKKIYFSKASLLGDKYLITGDRKRVMILVLVAILVLVIALVNFLNISSSQWQEKIRQTGVLKVIGARQSAIFINILAESFIFFFASLLISIYLVSSFSQFILNYTGIHYSQKITSSAGFIAISLGVILILSVIFSIIPALRIASSRAVDNLKNRVKTGAGRQSFRGFLVMMQFIIAIALIAFTVLVQKQVRFGNTSLGFNHDNILSIKLTDQLSQKKDVLKNMLAGKPGIRKFCFSQYFPGKFISEWQNELIQNGDKKVITFNTFSADANFFEMLDLQLIMGRLYTDNLSTDKKKIVVNETFLHDNNILNPLGATITTGGNNSEIIGVVKDFHFKSVDQPITPLAIRNDASASYCLATIQAGDFTSLSDLVNNIKKTASELSPSFPVEISFLDQAVQNMYQSEIRFRRAFSLLAFFAIVLCSLGILAMSLFACQKRVKEIGIRKVNGARISEILIMLNSDFVKWVGIAFVVACPVAFYAGHAWLKGFAYKTDLSWWIFVLGGLMALGIALLTVSWQSWRAATRNPVEALRYE